MGNRNGCRAVDKTLSLLILLEKIEGLKGGVRSDATHFLFAFASV